MNLRRCPVCEGMVLELPPHFVAPQGSAGPIDWAAGPQGPTFARHLPANRSKEPATHMDGACFGSCAPTLVATPEWTPVRDDEFDAHGNAR